MPADPIHPALAQSVLLRDLEAAALAEVAAAGRTRRQPDEAFFFMQDDPAKMVYVLLEGKVKLSQVTEDGQQVLMGYLGPGREFGVIAVIKAMTYPVSAQAVGECLAMSWEAGQMSRLIERHPAIARNAMHLMARQIREFQNRIRELSTQRVERRIARTLLRLAQQTGRKTEEGVLIDLPVTRQDLAELCGATLFTVSRTLKQWETQGLILSQRQRVVIRFPHGLVRIAEDLGE